MGLSPQGRYVHDPGRTAASIGSATELAESQDGGPVSTGVNAPQMQDSVEIPERRLSLSAGGI